jgi:hypothetical protein
VVNFGDIYYLNIAYQDRFGSKGRPAMILKIDYQGDSKCYGIYTKQNYWDRFDFVEKVFMYKPRDYEFANLFKTSYIDISDVESFRLADLALKKAKGHLSEFDMEQVLLKIIKYQRSKEILINRNSENIVSYLKLHSLVKKMSSKYNKKIQRLFVDTFSLHFNGVELTPRRLDKLCEQTFIPFLDQKQ